MEKFIQTKTDKTPSILLDAKEGLIEIKGRSIPENSVTFYMPMFEWLREYSEAANKQTTVHIQFEYYNTDTSRCILELMKRLNIISEKGSQVVLNWYYEEGDQDMLEAGEDYKSMVKGTINFIELKNEF